MNSMSSVKMPYGAVDFRVMTKQMVDAILSMSEVQRFSKGIFCWVGFDTKWIPYENVERTIGTSSWSFWGLFRYAIDGITSFSVSPLKTASFASPQTTAGSLLHEVQERVSVRSKMIHIIFFIQHRPFGKIYMCTIIPF